MKEIKIVNYETKYLNDMSNLFILNYKNLLLLNPLMPKKYLLDEEITPRLKRIAEKYPCVVALKDNSVVGYLSGIIIPEFKSSNVGVYTPEWAHAFESIEIYNLMFKEISSEWDKKHYSGHAITFLANLRPLVNQMFWNGYGMFVIDVIRNVDLVETSANEQLEIREANSEDISNILPLLKEHNDYMGSSPTYLLSSNENLLSEIKEYIADDNKKIMIALIDKEIVGLMKTVYDGDDASTVVRDEKTLSLSSTHVKKGFRGLGIAKHLLNKVITIAKDLECERVSVDFESANIEARNFWLNHFDIVCYSVIRYFDDRVN